MRVERHVPGSVVAEALAPLQAEADQLRADIERAEKARVQPEVDRLLRLTGRG